MFNWLFNKKENDVLLDNNLTPTQKKYISYKILPDLILRLNQIVRTDAEFREETLRLIKELQSPIK